MVESKMASWMRVLGVSCLLSSCCLQSYATAVIVLVRPGMVVIGTDSSDVNQSGRRIGSTPKIAVNGQCAFVASGVQAWRDRDSVVRTTWEPFLNDPAFTHPASPEALLSATARWADQVIREIDSSPNSLAIVLAQRKGTLAVFVARTSAGDVSVVTQQILIEHGELIHTGAIVPVANLALDAGYSTHEVITELQAQKTVRARAVPTLLPNMLHGQGSPVMLTAARDFIALTEAWYPKHTWGAIQLVQVSRSGLVWATPKDR